VRCWEKSISIEVKSEFIKLFVIYWGLNMVSKAKAIVGITFFVSVYISAILLFLFIVDWFIRLISPGVADIWCGGIAVLMIGIYAFQKTRSEGKDAGCITVFRWLVFLLTIVLFLRFYPLINTLGTSEQYGCGILLFVGVILFIAPLFFPPPWIKYVDDDY
jgi:hypothetical protein